MSACWWAEIFQSGGKLDLLHSFMGTVSSCHWHPFDISFFLATIQDRMDLSSSLGNLNGGTAWTAPTSRRTWITVIKKQYRAFMQSTQTHSLFYRSPATNHFQKWRFSEHTVTLLAFSHLMFGRFCKQKDNTFLYPRTSGCLVRRGTSQAFCENKKPFSWLFTDDLQRISERFEHGWAEQLLRIQIHGCKPASFHWLCFEKCRNEACPKLMVSSEGTMKRKPCLISVPRSLKADSLCYHFWKLFSVWVPAVISWAAMCFFELEGGWMNDDMKMIACICVVCTEMYQSLQWIMHVPLPLDFCSVGFHFLCVFCRTKAGFPNFLGSQNASSIIIKNCVEEHRITGSSKARLAPNPCVVSVCIGKGWNKVTYKVSCTSPVIRANCSVPPGSFLTRNRY